MFLMLDRSRKSAINYRVLKMKNLSRSLYIIRNIIGRWMDVLEYREKKIPLVIRYAR